MACDGASPAEADCLIGHQPICLFRPDDMRFFGSKLQGLRLLFRQLNFDIGAD